MCQRFWFPVGIYAYARGTHFPEVLNDFVVLSVAAIVGMLLPIIDINIRDTTNQQLQFSFIENVDEIGWYQLIETREESLELLLDSFLNSPLRNQPE